MNGEPRFVRRSGFSGLVGDVSARRVARVVFRRWYVVAGFLAAGGLSGFAVCRLMPPVYEAVATFTMNFNRASAKYGDDTAVALMGDGAMTYGELYNTRLAEWYSQPVAIGLLRAYRTLRPGSKVPDDEIMDALANARIELKPMSRLVEVRVRAATPQLCTDLAQAYVGAIAANAETQSDARRARATKLMEENVARQRAIALELAHITAANRVTNAVESLRTDLELAERGLSYTVGELLRLEGEELRLVEVSKILDEVAQTPSAYGKLLATDSRSAEIARAAEECLELEKKCREMLGLVTKRHPAVRQAGRELLAARARLKAVARRAKDSGQASLRELKPRIDALKERKADLELKQAHNKRMLSVAENEVQKDERRLAAARSTLKALMVEENRMRSMAELGREVVVPGCPPTEPDTPVIPDPATVYGIAMLIAATAGVFVSLLLDRMADPLLDVWDVMQRVNRPVLARLPRVSVKERREIVQLMVDSPRSVFAERVRGLRQLLDSPRFESASHCILVVSTAPGEGKTITAASLAAAFAQAGRRTLLVDFDLRRPRQAEVWKLSMTPETSLSHVLSSAKSRSPDFAVLAHRQAFDGLDVIASLPPDGVDPATLTGSMSVRAFFAWARATYDGIVVDAPPFGTVADTVSLASLTDSAIVMCRPEVTNAGRLAACVEYLSDTGAEILGIVVNDVDPRGSAFADGHESMQFNQCPPGADPEAFEETRPFSDED